MDTQTSARPRTSSPSTGTSPGTPDSAVEQVLTRVKRDQATILASAIAFWGFLSLFPALIAAMTIYGLVADPAQIRSTVSSVLGNVSSDVQSVVTKVLQGVAGGGTALTWGLVLSLVGLLWSASAVTAYLLRAMSLANEQEPRSGVKSRLLAVPLTFAFLLVAALVIGVVAVLPAVLQATGLSGVAQAGATVGAYAALIALLIGTGTVLYSKGPAEDGPSTKSSAIGAAVATGVWLVGSVLFTLYVSTFGSYSSTYAGVAGIVVLLLWFFLSAFAIVLGVIVASVRDARSGRHTPYP